MSIRSGDADLLSLDRRAPDFGVFDGAGKDTILFDGSPGDDLIDFPARMTF